MVGLYKAWTTHHYGKNKIPQWIALQYVYRERNLSQYLTAVSQKKTFLTKGYKGKDIQAYNGAEFIIPVTT